MLQAADPSYPERAIKYEALMSAIEHGVGDEVTLVGLQELEGSEQTARAVLSAMSSAPSGPNKVWEMGSEG